MEDWDIARIGFAAIGEGLSRKERNRIQRSQAEVSERIAVRRAVEKSDPESAKRLVLSLAQQLVDGRDLTYWAREYLHDALVATAERPSTAGAAFGLVRPKHRPKAKEVELRNWRIAERINALGLPLKGNRKQEGAASIAAREFEVEEATALAAWNEYGRYIRTWLENSQEKPRTTG